MGGGGAAAASAAAGPAAGARQRPGSRRAAALTLRAAAHAAAGFPFPLGPFFERKTLRYEVRGGWLRPAACAGPAAQRHTAHSAAPGGLPPSASSRPLRHPPPTPRPHTRPPQVVKDTIWTFEQTQALDFFDVYTPVRMTAIKLKSGGLWVRAPRRAPPRPAAPRPPAAPGRGHLPQRCRPWR